MKKTILKFIKSPAFDVFIFVVACICSIIAFSIYCFTASASSNSDLYYNEYGYLTYTSPSFNSSYDYSTYFTFNPVSIVDGDPLVTIPSGYNQFCYSVYSSNSQCQLAFLYCASDSLPRYLSSSSPSLQPNDSRSFYEARYRVTSDGGYSLISASPVSSFSLYAKRASFLLPVQDGNGNILRPAADVQFTLNTAVIGYNIAFNSQINIGESSVVDYYIFPSTTPISSGSTSTIVPLTSASELTSAQQENFFVRGFKWMGEKISELITDISSPKVSLSTSTSARNSTLFNPSSYGVAFEKIGSGRLYASGDTSISPTASLSLKDMISSHTGVYASSTLKLVAVVNTSNTSFIATFDFAPANIVGGSPVPSTTLQGQVPFPDFQNSNSDFKELADYLKNLMQANNDNSIRNYSNFMANLLAVPWSNYVGNGVYNGLNGFLPNLSAEFDTMFNGLFTDFFVPDLEDIEAQVDEDEAAFTDKFQWVHDIKSEVNFIVHTPLAADDDEFVFKATIQKYSIGEVIFFDSEWIDGSTRIIVKRVITVFCTIALIVYIFKTLPSTLGNMPTD